MHISVMKKIKQCYNTILLKNINIFGLFLRKNASLHSFSKSLSGKRRFRDSRFTAENQWGLQNSDEMSQLQV